MSDLRLGGSHIVSSPDLPAARPNAKAPPKRQVSTQPPPPDPDAPTALAKMPASWAPASPSSAQTTRTPRAYPLTPDAQQVMSGLEAVATLAARVEMGLTGTLAYAPLAAGFVSGMNTAFLKMDPEQQRQTAGMLSSLPVAGAIGRVAREIEGAAAKPTLTPLDVLSYLSTLPPREGLALAGLIAMDVLEEARSNIAERLTSLGGAIGEKIAGWTKASSQAEPAEAGDPHRPAEAEDSPRLPWLSETDDSPTRHMPGAF